MKKILSTTSVIPGDAANPNPAIRQTPGTRGDRGQTSPWRVIKTAAWLGWQVEANWTDPLLFIGITLLRPFATAMIVAVIFGVIRPGDFGTLAFAGIFVGNAFWALVGQISSGISYTIMEDREQYRTLKYMFTAPMSFTWFLVGRGAARILMGLAAAAIVFVCGVLLIGVRIDPTRFDILLLLYSIVCGLVTLVMIGLVLAGISMRIARHGGFIGDATAGALFVFSGAVFPLTVLPEFLRYFSACLPVSWWIECLKRSFIGNTGSDAVQALSFPALSTPIVMLGLGIATLVMLVAGYFVFRRLVNSARERGLIDAIVNY